MINTTSTDNKKYWHGLKVSPILRNRLYVLSDAVGGPKELWEADRNALIELGLTEEHVSQAIAFRETFDLDADYKALHDHGIRMVSDEDAEYPCLLRYANGRPRAFYVKGAIRDYEIAVGIVGARRSTTAGKAIASEVAQELTRAGVTIISGAARGIDTAAHWGAIEAGGRTYAVLGCGLDIVYPPENRSLFHEIEEKGALISEYPPGTAPLPMNFPTRNRIVAGMCTGILVVEAGNKSGALITADFALSYGREVFAVPGFSKSEVSKGAHKLIKQGAYLVENAQDILELLGIESQPSSKRNSLTERERDFLDVLGWEAMRIDEILYKTRLDFASISALLLSLEISGFMKRDISGCYIRVR